MVDRDVVVDKIGVLLMIMERLVYVLLMSNWMILTMIRTVMDYNVVYHCHLYDHDYYLMIRATTNSIDHSSKWWLTVESFWHSMSVKDYSKHYVPQIEVQLWNSNSMELLSQSVNK